MCRSPWRNLSASPHDGETADIDRLEGEVGEISGGASEVRQLITRFEPCHFKCVRHLDQILRSIRALKPVAEPEQIGAAHPRHGPAASEADPTGRSRIGQRYLAGMRHWLGEGDEGSESDAAGELEGHVHGLLGEPDSTKERLVSRLIDRLLWRFEERAESSELETELEEQIDRTDICHSSFPRNLELVLSGIGKLRPETDFSGCGSVDGETVVELRSRYEALCKWIAGDSASIAGVPVERASTKVWLVACLAKTIKEQCGLEGALPALGHGTGDILE